MSMFYTPTTAFLLVVLYGLVLPTAESFTTSATTSSCSHQQFYWRSSHPIVQIRSGRQKLSLLQSSQRRSPNNKNQKEEIDDDYYEYYDYYEEEENTVDRTIVENSKVEKEFRDFRSRNSNPPNGYYEQPASLPRNNRSTSQAHGSKAPTATTRTIRFSTEYYEDDYDDKYDDEYDYDDDEEENEYKDLEEEDSSEGGSGGNFWSNPKGSMDRPTPTIRNMPCDELQPRRVVTRRRKYDDYEYYDDDDDENDVSRDMSSQKKRKRTSVRSNEPTVPKPAKDLYERLFWYGFDPDESEGVGDKTVFGGTKGKFNGLSYLKASEESLPVRPITPRRRRGRALPPSKLSPKEQQQQQRQRRRGRQEAYEDYDDDNFVDDDYDDGEDDNDETQEKTRRRPSVKPPVDPPYLQVGRPYANSDGDWAYKQVSSWFKGKDDEDDYVGDYSDDSRSQRRSRRKQSDWSPFNVLDAFFGVDRNEMEYKANMYDERMGLGGERTQRSRRDRQRRPPRKTPPRAGYAYRYRKEEDDEDYDNDDDENGLKLSEIETTAEALYDDKQKIPKNNNGVGDGTSRNKEEMERPDPCTRELTWEERSLSVERVPPGDIPAWGPSGELPIDARTKALTDALLDIETARHKLESREKKEALAREEITILNVDAEVQRRRLKESRKATQLARERLRQIELDIDDASRMLRRARTQVQLARDELEELRERHWALLKFYNPDQAEEKVSEALKELQQLEPAARRLVEFNFVQEKVQNEEASGIPNTYPSVKSSNDDVGSSAS